MVFVYAAQCGSSGSDVMHGFWMVAIVVSHSHSCLVLCLVSVFVFVCLLSSVIVCTPAFRYWKLWSHADQDVAEVGCGMFPSLGGSESSLFHAVVHFIHGT